LKNQKPKVKSQKYSLIHSYIYAKRKNNVSLYGWMKSLFSILIFLILIFVFVTACDNNTVIPEEKFIHVYVDLMIVQDTTRSNPLSLDSLKEIVFTKHDITSGLYDKTIAKYNSSPEDWEEFFDKAIAYLEELKTKND